MQETGLCYWSQLLQRAA